jgi:hypothetical protein
MALASPYELERHKMLHFTILLPYLSLVGRIMLVPTVVNLDNPLKWEQIRN